MKLEKESNKTHN